jgi:hypothetical protein
VVVVDLDARKTINVHDLEIAVGQNNGVLVIHKHLVLTGFGKCPTLGILNITFKYLLEIISPIFG